MTTDFYPTQPLTPPKAPHLTPRQLAVLVHLSHGYTLPVIAQHLGVSYSTAHTHAEHLRKALGARNNAHGMTRAFRTGLLPAPLECATCAQAPAAPSTTSED